MLLLFEKGIRGGICEAITKYKKANNHYMKNYDKTKPSSYLMYVDANNLYGYAMSKKLPTGDFQWIEDISIFTEDYIKNYDENSDTGYLLVADVTYPKDLYEQHKYLPFLPDKIKIDKSTKLSCNFNDKNNYPVHICALKQALNHGLKLEKVHSVISFSQSAWLKQYIDRNTEFRMKANNDFEKDYYKLLNNSFYGKTMENVRNHRDIRLVNTENKKSKLASEPNYHSNKHISEDFLIMGMKRREIRMNKPIYLGQAILDYSKMLMYEFWYDYLQPMYNDKIELCYMDTDSFIIYVETKDSCKDISKDFNKWFDASNYSKDIDRPLEKGKNKKAIGKFKDELGGLVMREFCAHRAKTYAFFIDGFNDNDYSKHGIINKKAKGTKKCVIENQIVFKDYINVLFDKVSLIKSQFGFRSRNHEIYTEKINKIALRSNDNKRIQCDDGINSYPYGYHNNANKDNNILLDDTNTLLDRINKIKNKSKKGIEESNKLLGECKVINDKLDKTIGKSKNKDKYDNLIEKVQILDKRCNNMSKDKNIFLEDTPIFISEMDQLKSKIKKRIEEPNKLLEEYIVINDKINTAIEK